MKAFQNVIRNVCFRKEKQTMCIQDCVVDSGICVLLNISKNNLYVHIRPLLVDVHLRLEDIN